MPGKSNVSSKSSVSEVSVIPVGTAASVPDEVSDVVAYKTDTAKNFNSRRKSKTRISGKRAARKW